MDKTLAPNVPIVQTFHCMPETFVGESLEFAPSAKVSSKYTVYMVVHTQGYTTAAVGVGCLVRDIFAHRTVTDQHLRQHI